MSRRVVGALVVLLAGLGLGAGIVWAALDTLGAPADGAEPVDTVSADTASAEAAADHEPEAANLDDAVAPVEPNEVPEPFEGSATVEAPAAPAAPSVPTAPDELVRSLGVLLADEDVQAVDRLSVIVLDEAGREVASLAPDQPVMPASTAKLLTAAAAYRLLGPDYRFVTKVFATTAPSDGVVDGDLVLVGSGDPTLASPTFITSVYPSRPHTPLDVLAGLVAARGIREIRGSVVGDGQLFASQPIPEGWNDGYLWDLDATRVSGLTVDGGRRIWERGEDLLAEADEDPARLAAEVLTRLLTGHGVSVTGQPVSGTASEDMIEVARLRSPPLKELLTHVVQESDNHMADGVFRALGARTGDGTWAGSEKTVEQTLEDVSDSWARITLADGSGLSRASRLTARVLAEVDRTMTSELGAQWQDLLAVTGESGTLRKRMRGTIAEGLLAGKTGALRDARSLAGQVAAPDGRRYHFAIAGSELDGSQIGVVRTLMDDLVIVLAGGPVPSREEAQSVAGGG